MTKPAQKYSPPVAQNKLKIVQALRAAAVLLVVWTHSIVASKYHSAPKQGQFHFLAGFGACGLDIFFVISGFIVSLVAARAIEQQSAARFLLRRFTRIFPLYWLLTLVVIGEAQFGRYPIQWHRVPWLPTILLLPDLHFPVPPLILSLGWSLLFEIYFYVVIALWMRITPKTLARNTIMFLVAVVALGSAIGIHHPILVIWSSPIALEFVFGCIIGLLYTRRNTIGTSRLAGICLMSLGAVTLVTTVFTGYGLASEANSILAGNSGWLRVAVWGVPSAFLVLGGVLWSPTMQSLPARTLIFIGDASYSIYLCTNPVRSAVEHFWRYAGRFGGDVGVLFCVIACVVVGIVCYLLIERPMMRFFHNWHKPIPFHSGNTQAS